MRFLTLLTFVLTVQDLFGQINLRQIEKEVIDEGLYLYRHERASWKSTDLLTDNHKQLSTAYFTYEINDTIKSIYFDKEKKLAIVQFHFIKTDSIEIDLINTIENKELTSYETILMNVRNHAHGISSVYYSTFGIPRGINPNIIIKERSNDFYVYSIPGTYLENLIPIGGDYWFTYTKQGKSLKFDLIHRNLIPFEARGEKEIMGTVHQHRDKSNKYITPTDICTLLLNRDFIEWDIHEVVSKTFISTFNLRTIKLTIEPNSLKRKM
jgi:hypothetical protein